MNSRRRWLQISTRTMFVLFTIIAIIVAYVGRQMYSDYRHELALDKIGELGGYVGAVSTDAVNVKQRRTFKRIQLRSVAPEKLDQLIHHLAYIPDMTQLELINSAVSDETLERIGRLPQLKRLYLFESEFNDNALKKLADYSPQLDIRMEQPDPIAMGLASRRIYRHALTAIALSHDGQQLAVGSGDGRVYCWTLDESGMPIGQRQTFFAHSNWVFDMAFSPNNRTIVTSGGDNSIRIWDARSLKLVREIVGHTDDVHQVAFFPDGSRLVSSSDDCTVRTWAVASGKPLLEISGHDDTIPALSISPDGKTIVSGSRDSTIRLWDADSGSLQSVLDSHADDVMSVRFISNEQFVSASYDGTARLFSFAFSTSDEIQPTVVAKHNEWLFDCLYDAGSQIAFTATASETLAKWREGHIVAKVDCKSFGVVSRLAMQSATGNIFATTTDGNVAIFDQQLRLRHYIKNGIDTPEFEPLFRSTLKARDWTPSAEI